MRPPAERRSPSAPPTGGLTEAKALVRAGKPEEALTILRPLARGRTVDADVLFHIGVAAIGASRKPGLSDDARDALLDEAIAALRILIGRPDLVRVRLEFARAFFLKGEDRLARRHFEQVLAGKPPAAVALNVNRFLMQIRARKRWSVGAALVPDSNLSTRSDEKTVLIDTQFGRLPFTYQGDEPESGIGVSVWAGGEYQYPLAERWRLRAGGDVSRGEYKASEFDQMMVPGHVGPRWLIGRASELSRLHQWTGSGVEAPLAPRYRDPRRGRPPAQLAHHGEPRRLPARAAPRRGFRSRRADDRHHGGDWLGGVSDGAHRHGFGPGQPED